MLQITIIIISMSAILNTGHKVFSKLLKPGSALSIKSCSKIIVKIMLEWDASVSG